VTSPQDPGVPPEVAEETMPAPVGPPLPPARHQPEVIAWAKAIAQGIGDTAKDMLDSAREGAAAERERRWEQFHRKTRERRQQ